MRSEAVGNCLIDTSTNRVCTSQWNYNHKLQSRIYGAPLKEKLPRDVPNQWNINRRRGSRTVEHQWPKHADIQSRHNGLRNLGRLVHQGQRSKQFGFKWFLKAACNSTFARSLKRRAVYTTSIKQSLLRLNSVLKLSGITAYVKGPWVASIERWTVNRREAWGLSQCCSLLRCIIEVFKCCLPYWRS